MSVAPVAGRETVYIVDDDADYRASLERFLAASDWTSRSFASVEGFLAECDDLAPGTLLLDLRLDGRGGISLLEEFAGELERFTVIVVTGHGDVETAVRSLKAGATDYLTKPFDPARLTEMLRGVEGTAEARMRNSASERAASAQVSALSPREFEVLTAMMAGHSNKVIARQLQISDRTVEMHRARLLAKLGVKSSAEAVRIATLAQLRPASPSRPGQGSKQREA